ncbi:hypothetical protein [Thiomonas sp. X19]|uniref:hypothetical protein n=1 Tax=Thiomonas sp. X19 TaxID=1050370 RepID=UPI0011BE6305
MATSVLDPQQAPAQELAALDRERWEIETALDELKTHLRGARIVLRSKTPDRPPFIHAVRVVRRKLPVFNAIPPVQRQAFHERVLDTILQEGVACHRGRRNLRSVKRTMSNWPLRRRHAKPPRPVVINQAIPIIKRQVSRLAGSFEHVP